MEQVEDQEAESRSSILSDPRLIAAFAEIRTAQRLLGHGNIKSTLRYLLHAADRLDEDADQEFTELEPV